MSESTEEINEYRCDGCVLLKYVLDYISKTPSLMQMGLLFLVFFRCMLLLSLPCRSLFIFLMVFSVLTLAILFISHQQFS